MKEKPIIFSTPMVQAILDGRKTQTRRVVKPQPKGTLNAWDFNAEVGDVLADITGKIFKLYESTGRNKAAAGELTPREIKPRYQPGDLLWVRETWQPMVNSDGITVGYHYFTGQIKWLCDTTGMEIQEPLRWKPSIHMPREAARIFLEVKDVRVEQVQEITWEDAAAEGWPRYRELFPLDNTEYKTIAWFKKLWDSLGAKRGYGWEANPWVWVIEFKRVEAGM